jgi:hypothetical protein
MISVTGSLILPLVPMSLDVQSEARQSGGLVLVQKQHMGGAGSMSYLNGILSARRQFLVATDVKKAAII